MSISLFFQEIIQKYDVIFITKFGSHLYGTATESSDRDFKGIYIPTIQDCIRGTVKKSIKFDTNKSKEKNNFDDIDFEMYSLQYFLELASKGETAAIDMLNANLESIIYYDKNWNKILSNSNLFYTKNMSALIGYAKKQAEKYIFKIDKLNTLHKLKDFLESKPQTEKILLYWDEIPIDQNIKKEESSNITPIRSLKFCGKVVHETVKVNYFLNIVNDYISSYGHRSNTAVLEGADWKSLSHAWRSAYELSELYEYGKITFPLKIADDLLKMKTGKYSVQTAFKIIEDQIQKVDELVKISKFPEEVNKEKIDNLLLSFFHINI